MESVVVGIAGLCFGVLISRSRVPHIQVLPMVCSLLLAAIGVVLLIQTGHGSLFNGLLLTFSALVAALVYSAELWKRQGLDKEYTPWDLIWMSVFRPGYLARSHAGSSDVDSEKTKTGAL